MKPSKISLVAALMAGVMLAYTPTLRAEDTKENKDTKTRQGRPGGRGGEGRQEYFNKMVEDLKLTAEQKTKVQEVFKNRGEKGRAIREDSSLSDEQKREKYKALMDESDKKMKDILTAEQFEKWQKNRPQRPPGGKSRGSRPGGDDKK